MYLQRNYIILSAFLRHKSITSIGVMWPFSVFQHYSDALELCKQAYGDYHILTGRITMNWGKSHLQLFVH